MDLSFFFARVLSIYFIVSALAVLVNKDRYMSAVKDLSKNPLLHHVLGALALIFGLIVVSLHNVWNGWPILITVSAWAIIFKGIVNLILPDVALRVIKDFSTGSYYTVSVFSLLVFGAFLFYIGFFV